MLDTMRKNTKVILWITVVAFLGLIVLVWGAESQVGCGATQGVVGRVNGSPIMVDYFNRILQANRENMRQSRGGEMGPGDEATAAKQTWDSIVEQMVLSQEATKRGLTPSDQEIREAARNNPPQAFTQNPSFQTNGQFDLAKYQAVLDNPDVDPTFFVQLEAYIRSTLPVEKLQAMVYAGATVSDAELKKAFRDRSEQARVTYRLFENRSYTLATPVTDADAQAYYKAHPEEFDLPAQATVRYAKVERKATDADIETIRQQMADYAVIARRAATGDSSALSFAALAETYSELPSAPQGGLDPTFHPKGQLAPAIDAAAFALPVGGVSDPIQDRLVFHIVQVDSIMDAPDGRKVRIRDMMVKIQPSDATITELEDKVRAIKEQGLKEGLDKAAKAAGLTLNTPRAFNEGGWIQGMESATTAADWAFHAKPGDVTSIPTNDAWYVIDLVSRSPKGHADFKAAAEMAKQKATEEKQRAMAEKDAEAFRARVAGASDWKMVAGADSNQVRAVGPLTRSSGVPGIGRDPEALGAAFSLPVGQVSTPLNVARGVLVMRVDERKPADESQFTAQKNQLTNQILNQRRSEIYQDWLKQLKARAEIKDYRDVYLKS